MDYRKNNYQSVIESVKKLKLLILDVDGVLTDGRLFFDQQGAEYKSFHARDGHGIKMLRETGVEVAVISGRKSAVVSLRMKNLGIQHVYQGYEDKIGAFEEILSKMKITTEQVAHVGDDLLDLPLMMRAGLGIAVQDANDTVKNYADCITEIKGGLGAVREICDFIMQTQGNFDRILQRYLD